MLDKHLLERRQFSEACVEVEELLLADSEELREEATSLEDEVQDQSSQARTLVKEPSPQRTKPYHNGPNHTVFLLAYHFVLPACSTLLIPIPIPILILHRHHHRHSQVQHLKIEKMQAVSAIEKIWRQRLDDDTRRLRDEMEGLRGRLDRKEEEAAKLLYVNIGNERKISELTKVSPNLGPI